MKRQLKELATGLLRPPDMAIHARGVGRPFEAAVVGSRHSH
ncbi:MAG TPA: hypothetical protein VHB99_14825 [Pirellulales bacterium]|nr:hypothetical protein [Pirellulales bacterium]